MSYWREVDEPRIWASRFPRFLDVVSFKWSSDGDRLKFIYAFDTHLKRVDPVDAPKFLYYQRHKKIPASTRDAFKIFDGLRVISPALRDVLIQFNLEGTQLFEVPIYKDECGTPSDLPNHYVLNVYASKDALIPELSENIEQRVPYFSKTQEKSEDWWPVLSNDVIALDAKASEGPDIWRLPNLKETLFFSDRLKQAIDAAGLKTKALSFAPARVFEKS